jgi:tetratricopeptide (TPR) repeat protein
MPITGSLVRHLERCTVRVLAKGKTRAGTGFFVSPGRILTCAHVVGERRAEGQEVEVIWYGGTVLANLEAIAPDPCPTSDILPDLALLRFSISEHPHLAEHPCALLDKEYRTGDALYSWGYSDIRAGGESLRGICEGDAAEFGGVRLIKFRETEIRPGISGSPVLNERTGAVCGIIKRTRDMYSDAGGLAIGVDEVISSFPDLACDNITFHRKNHQWDDAVAQDLIERNVTNGAAFFRARLRGYLACVRRYSNSPYRSLPLPEGFSQESVYVPQRTRVRGDAQSGGVYRINQLFQWLTSQEKKNLLVSGNPGSGKSTLLWYIAKHCFDSPTALGTDRKAIPMVVRLEALVRTTGSTIEQRLVAALRESRDVYLDDELPEGFLREWPAAEGCKWLFLLDAYDEVAVERRAELHAFIRELIKCGHDIVISSRPPDSIDGDLSLHFSSCQLEPFSHGEQEELAQKWLGSDATEFLNDVKIAGGRQAFSTPLLLTVAASLYRSDKRLPPRRVDLYQRFCDKCYEEAESRGILSELGPELSSDYPDVLKELAFFLTEHEAATSEELEGYLTTILSRRLGRPEAGTEGFSRRYLEVMGRRSGVFIFRTGASDWLHSTFREFLAAQFLAKSSPFSPDVIAIMERWRTDRWKQVLLFLLALCSDRYPVTELARRFTNSARPYGLVFCADALAEGTKLETGFEEELTRQLCAEASRNAHGTICNRLLAGLTSDTQVRANEVLRSIVQLKHRGSMRAPMTRLVETMIKYASEWRSSMGNAAVNDLGILESHSALLAIAQDTGVYQSVRCEAAIQLARAGRVEESTPILQSLLRSSDLEESTGVRILDAFGEISDETELMTQARYQDLYGKYRRYVPIVLFKSRMINGLKILYGDESVDAKVRNNALLGLLGNDPCVKIDRLQELFVAADDAEINYLLDILRRMENWNGLVLILETRELPVEVHERASHMLPGAGGKEVLFRVVGNARINLGLQLSAAKELRKRVETSGTADFLEAFYRDATNRGYDLEILRERAELYRAQGRLELAIADYSAIIKEAPSDDVALAYRANCYRTLDRFGEALTDFNCALAIDPEDTWDLVRRGLVHWELRNWSAAAEDFTRAGELGSRESFYYKYHAHSLIELSHFDEALTLSDKAVEQDPGSAMAHGVRGEVLSAVGRWEEAVGSFDQALLLKSEYAWVLERRGVAHRCRGQLEFAFADFTSRLALSDSRWARTNRCALAIRLREYDTARSDLELLRFQDDSTWSVYLSWLFNNSVGEHNDEARIAEEVAKLVAKLSESPTDRYARSNLAFFSLIMGDFETARKLFLGIISEKSAIRFVRQEVAPELEDFVAIANLTTPAADILNEMRATEVTLRAKPKLEQPRDIDVVMAKARGISHPVYCRLMYIHGFEKEKARGEALLAKHTRKTRAVAFWRIEEDWIYAQCNFKYDDNDISTFKFIDTVSTILEKDIPILRDGGVRDLFFVERELMKKFDDRLQENSDDWVAFHCHFLDDGRL